MSSLNTYLSRALIEECAKKIIQNYQKLDLVFDQKEIHRFFLCDLMGWGVWEISLIRLHLHTRQLALWAKEAHPDDKEAISVAISGVAAEQKKVMEAILARVEQGKFKNDPEWGAKNFQGSYPVLSNPHNWYVVVNVTGKGPWDFAWRKGDGHMFAVPPQEKREDDFVLSEEEWKALNRLSD